MFSQLIIPEKLGTLSLEAGTRGSFKGDLIQEECLAVARSSRVGDAEPFFVPGSGRLFAHWSFLNGTSRDRLVPWVAVNPGFGVALLARQISRIGLREWITDGMSTDPSEEPIAMLCCVEPVEGREARVHLLLLADEKVILGKVQSVAAGPRESARTDGLRPIKSLQGKRVAVVGLGSGGSMAALDLAAAGVGTLHLFDRDELNSDNLFRHACDLRHLGRAKVLAVRDLIQSFDLPSSVVPYEQDVVENAKTLWAAMHEVDMVLCATDNVPSRRLVNYLAVHTDTPLAMACTFRNARLGEIIRVLPAKTACYECTRLALREAGAIEPLVDGEEDASAPDSPYGLAEGDSEHPAQSANQGTRADVAIVAALLCRVAITTLLAGEGEADHLPSNYLAWGGRIETELPDPFNFERPFGTNWAHIAPREDCPVCGSPRNLIDATVDEEYEKIMASLPDAAPQ